MLLLVYSNSVDVNNFLWKGDDDDILHEFQKSPPKYKILDTSKDHTKRQNHDLNPFFPFLETRHLIEETFFCNFVSFNYLIKQIKLEPGVRGK